MNSIKRNFMYNSAYQFLTFLIPLITMPYLSRVLGAEGIGRYSYSASIAYYFIMFGLLGLDNYGNRTIASVRDNENELSKNFCNIYAMQLMISLIVLVLYVCFAIIQGNDKLMFLIQSLYVLSVMFEINWFFFGLEKFKLTVIRNTIIKILSVISIFIFVKDASDIYIYALIMSGSFVLSNISLFFLLKKYVHFVCPQINEIIKHIKPNLILFVPVLATSIYKAMDKTMLGIFSNINEVGYYENSMKLVQIPISLVTALGVVMLPRISNLVYNGDFKKNNKYLDSSIKLAMFLSTSIGFGIMSISKSFVPIFFGEGFEKCVVLLQILLPSCIFLSISSVIRMQYLIPMKRDKVYIISTVCGAMVNFCINLLLIPYLQSTGAAIGTLCAELIVFYVQCILINKEIKIFKYIKRATGFLFSGLMMLLVLKVIDIKFNPSFTVMIMQIITGILVYFISFYFYEKTRFEFKKCKG